MICKSYILSNIGKKKVKCAKNANSEEMKYETNSAQTRSAWDSSLWICEMLGSYDSVCLHITIFV